MAHEQQCAHCPRAPVGDVAGRQRAMAEPTLPDLRGRRVLVAEDEPLIGLELHQELAGAGAEVIGPMAALPEVMAAAASSSLDAAIIDIRLGDRYVWPAAEVLLRRGIPIVFLTGYSAAQIPPAFAGSRVMQKPVATRTVLAEVARLTQSPGG